MFITLHNSYNTNLFSYTIGFNLINMAKEILVDERRKRNLILHFFPLFCALLRLVSIMTSTNSVVRMQNGKIK